MQGRNWARSFPRKIHHILNWQGCDAGPPLGSLASRKQNSRNFTSVCRGHHHGHRSSLSASASPSSAFSGPYSITTLHIVSIVRRHQRHRRRQDSHHPHHRHHHHTYVTYRRPHHRHPHHHTSSTSSHHHIITSSTSSHHHTSSTSSHIITHHRHAHIIDIIIDIHIYLFNHSTMIVYMGDSPTQAYAAASIV